MNMPDHKPLATATLRLARRVALPLAFPLLSLLAAPAAFALAEGGKVELQAVQGRWADIHYGLPEKHREAAKMRYRHFLHSLESATTGSSRAALMAGARPKIRPTDAAQPSDSIITGSES